ncbi:MAG TPA: hypothetical protein VM370_03560 [Candidatus Thermoplasmatota archaeon]|nr:hypothetical protein [Candidatus Thermoplasmatota archaeon]
MRPPPSVVALAAVFAAFTAALGAVTHVGWRMTKDPAIPRLFVWPMFAFLVAVTLLSSWITIAILRGDPRVAQRLGKRHPLDTSVILSPLLEHLFATQAFREWFGRRPL